ncbi:HAD-like domain-containing protein [Haematococcus lacustris]
MTSAPVTHVIFDMDGLLLDTESLYSVAQQQILNRYNKQFTWELKTKMMGRKALEAMEVLVADLELQDQVTAEQLLKERTVVLDQLFADAALMPGAERLVRHLAGHGIPMAVATSSSAAHFELKTRRHGELFALFHHIVTGDQVEHSKPHPEIFHKAALLFQGPHGSPPAPSPSSCLVFEDAPLGVEAGRAAGMRVVMVPDPQLDPDQSRAAQQVLGSLEQFRPEAWGLPPYPGEGGEGGTQA